MINEFVNLIESAIQIEKDIESGILPREDSYFISNTNKLKDYLENNEFPTLESFGEEVLNHMMHIVQHSDHDLSFQEMILEKVQALEEKSLFPKKWIPFLTDRILVAKGKPQVYGTQGRDFDGVWRLCELKFSEEMTNKLRLKYNIVPNTLEEYRQMMNGDDSVLDKYFDM